MTPKAERIYTILSIFAVIVGVYMSASWVSREFKRSINIRNSQSNQCAAGALYSQNPQESYDVCMKFKLSSAGTAENPSGVLAPGDEWDF